MKYFKLITLIIFVATCCSCTVTDISEPLVDDSYIETIPEEAKSWLDNKDTILMTNEDITKYNKALENESDYITNIDSINNKDKGIVINRAILRNAPNYSNTVETGLYVGMPIVILKEKNNWYQIQTYFYEGWIEKENIVMTSDEEYNNFQNPNQFIIITDSFYDTNGIKLDMSSKLPYLGVKDDKYKALLPIKDDNGKYQTIEILIPRSSAHIGYLDYTKDNLIIQAFKYLNIPYGWGDVNDGIDCSSFIANIYRTFGLYIPRNSSQQNDTYFNQLNIVGSKNKTNEIKKYPLSILCMKGHTMLYLGEIDNKQYIIDANGMTRNVAYRELPYTNDILTINQIP